MVPYVEYLLPMNSCQLEKIYNSANFFHKIYFVNDDAMLGVVFTQSFSA